MNGEQKFYLGIGGLIVLALLAIIVGPQSCVRDVNNKKLECIKLGQNATECDRAFAM